MASRGLKLTTAIVETVLAVPLLGGLLILSTAWLMLAAALVLHIITLVVSIRENKSKAGSIVGIVANALGWIPFVGWALHLTTAIMLWIAWGKNK